MQYFVRAGPKHPMSNDIADRVVHTRGPSVETFLNV